MATDKSEVAAFGEDFDMDELAELPSFKPFPTGAFKVKLEAGLERKKIGTHDAFEANMTLMETLELKDLDSGEEVPKIGDKCSTVFMLDNEIGQGKLRDFIKPIVQLAGSSKMSAIVATSKGIELLIIGKRVADKEDKDKRFFNIVQCALI